MDVFVCGPVGLGGTLKLLESEAAALEKRYAKSYLRAARERITEAIVKDALPEGLPVIEAGEGGIYAALWELAEREGCGLRLDLRAIPILQETVEICNTLDLDPYRIESGGCLLVFANGRQACEQGTWIGYTTKDKKRILTYDEVERYLKKEA